MNRQKTTKQDAGVKSKHYRYRVSHECMSPEFAEVVVDFKDEDTDFHLLAAGLLPRTRIVEYAEKAMAFDGTTVGTGDLFKNVLFSLGSPLIGGMAKDLYVAFSAPKGRDVSKPVRACVLNALAGNPLMHGGGHGEMFGGAAGREYFARNAATFGDLHNPNVVKRLVAILGTEAGKPANDLASAVTRDGLLERADVPEELVLALDTSPSSDCYDHMKLVEKEWHQRLVANDTLDGIKGFPQSDGPSWVVSPATSLLRIRAKYDSYGAWNSNRGGVLLAEKCPEEYYDNAVLDKDMILSDPLFLSDSPWAKKHIWRNGTPWASFAEEIAARDENGLAVVALPVAPFEKIAPANLREVFKSRGDIAAANIVGVIRSKRFASELGRVGDDPPNDIAFIFSPHTSGRQLEAFVAAHPEIAVLAACHPNGCDIPLQCVPPEHREIVEKAREPFLLTGKASATQTRGAQHLEI